MALGIRTVLILAFLIASGAPLAVYWVWPHSAVLDNKVDEVRERHLLLAKNLGFALESYHRDLIEVFGAFAPKIATGEADEAKSVFTNLHFRHVCVAEPASGRVLRQYLATTYKCPAVIPAARLAQFIKLAANDGVTLSNVVVPEGEEPRIYIVTRYGGLLVVGAIKTTFFKELQKRISFGRKGHAAIVDASGRVLAHPLADWEDGAADLSKVSAVQRMLAGESGVETFYSPALKGDMIAGFTAVKGSGWGVMVPQPVVELEEVADRINRDSFLVLLAGLALSSVIALLVSSQISRRINRVEMATRQVAEGDRNVRVEDTHKYTRIRELSSLTDGFNRMATEIEEAGAAEAARTVELEVANQTLRSEIIERQGAEAALQVSEKRFRNLFESEPIATREEDFSQIKAKIDALGIEGHDQFIAYLDEHPEFTKECGEKIVLVDANIAALKLHGISDKEQFLHNTTRNLSDKSLKILKTVLIAIHHGDQLVEFETTVTPVNGPERTVMARWSVAAGYEKTFARILLTSVDVTDSRQTEERLKQAQKMEAVGQLTGGVAHDFNNLLAVIKGNAELLADAADSNSALAAPIIRAVTRGAELTQRLLAFSRQQPLRPQVIELGPMVSGMSDMLARTLGETIDLDAGASAGVWNVLADAGQVENALLNLALNARDAMPDGGKLTIECSNTHLDEASLSDNSEAVAGDYVALSVSDDGTGMTEEVKAHAFEPFFTTKEVGEGSGLGLSMVYGFAKQSGGHVSIYSEADKGTTVKLYLPRAMSAKQEISPPQDRGVPAQGQGEMIMVIEDDPDVRALAVLMLHNLGYQVIDVADAAGADKVLGDGRPVDLILSDIVLPGGVSGPQFAERARAIYPDIKIIFMSGYPAEAAMRNGFLGSADVLLNKPFERRQLADTLRATLA